MPKTRRRFKKKSGKKHKNNRKKYTRRGGGEGDKTIKIKYARISVPNSDDLEDDTDIKYITVVLTKYSKIFPSNPSNPSLKELFEKNDYNVFELKLSPEPTPTPSESTSKKPSTSNTSSITTESTKSNTSSINTESTKSNTSSINTESTKSNKTSTKSNKISSLKEPTSNKYSKPTDRILGIITEYPYYIPLYQQNYKQSVFSFSNLNLTKSSSYITTKLLNTTCYNNNNLNNFVESENLPNLENIDTTKLRLGKICDPVMDIIINWKSNYTTPKKNLCEVSTEFKDTSC